MPTLLSVNSYHYRRDGAEVVYLDHNRLFSQRGWSVVPFAMRHPSNEKTAWSEYFVEEIEYGREYGLWEKMTRASKVVYSLEAQRHIEALCRRIDPQVCHCHSIYHHLSPSILRTLKQLGYPVVMTVHDLKIACPAYFMYSRGTVCESCRESGLHSVLLRRCIKDSLSFSALAWVEALVQTGLGLYRNGVDLFIAPSRFYIEKLVEWGWDRAKFRHVPNPVDVQRFQPHYVVGTNVLYFGRLSPEKGLETLIHAASAAEVPLRIAGDGPMGSHLRSLAAELKADVTFLGRLAIDELMSEIRACRATVLPSEWYENAPMSILESYAMGKPVVAADIGGNSELVVHGETGWLFESGSRSALADRLADTSACGDAQIERMGRNGRALAEKSYSTTEYVRNVLGVYQELGVRT